MVCRSVKKGDETQTKEDVSRVDQSINNEIWKEAGNFILQLF